ncbi:Dcp1-like decapping family protein [Zalerion maritima]|uniref:Dcp1-like decapping family protein n=1 Tax=Zalerion maritima TaxID=339359 RepID=A0AAD5RTM4_9PEZI|nr:Dcp1-like decapping family protein [Zalerion maritima]
MSGRRPARKGRGGQAAQHNNRSQQNQSMQAQYQQFQTQAGFQSSGGGGFVTSDYESDIPQQRLSQSYSNPNPGRGDRQQQKNQGYQSGYEYEDQELPIPDRMETATLLTNEEMNAKVLRRYMPGITSVLRVVNHVTVYHWSNEAVEWESTKIEGSSFLLEVARSDGNTGAAADGMSKRQRVDAMLPPRQCFFLLNRKNLHNLILDLGLIESIEFADNTLIVTTENHGALMGTYSTGSFGGDKSEEEQPQQQQKITFGLFIFESTEDGVGGSDPYRKEQVEFIMDRWSIARQARAREIELVEELESDAEEEATQQEQQVQYLFGIPIKSSGQSLPQHGMGHGQPIPELQRTEQMQAHQQHPPGPGASPSQTPLHPGHNPGHHQPHAVESTADGGGAANGPAMQALGRKLSLSELFGNTGSGGGGDSANFGDIHGEDGDSSGEKQEEEHSCDGDKDGSGGEECGPGLDGEETEGSPVDDGVYDTDVDTSYGLFNELGNDSSPLGHTANGTLDCGLLSVAAGHNDENDLNDDGPQAGGHDDHADLDASEDAGGDYKVPTSTPEERMDQEHVDGPRDGSENSENDLDGHEDSARGENLSCSADTGNAKIETILNGDGANSTYGHDEYQGPDAAVPNKGCGRGPGISVSASQTIAEHDKAFYSGSRGNSNDRTQDGNENSDASSDQNIAARPEMPIDAPQDTMDQQKVNSADTSSSVDPGADSQAPPLDTQLYSVDQEEAYGGNHSYEVPPSYDEDKGGNINASEDSGEDTGVLPIDAVQCITHLEQANDADDAEISLYDDGGAQGGNEITSSEPGYVSEVPTDAPQDATADQESSKDSSHCQKEKVHPVFGVSDNKDAVMAGKALTGGTSFVGTPSSWRKRIGAKGKKGLLWTKSKYTSLRRNENRGEHSVPGSGEEVD